jgi:hypothetical protein
MAYGLKLLDSSGNVDYDSTSTGGVYINTVIIPTTGSGYVTYDGTSTFNSVTLPNLKNKVIFWITLFNGDQNWYYDPVAVYDPEGPSFIPRIRYVQLNTSAINDPSGTVYRNSSKILVFAK